MGQEGAGLRERAGESATCQPPVLISDGKSFSSVNAVHRDQVPFGWPLPLLCHLHCRNSQALFRSLCKIQPSLNCVAWMRCQCRSEADRAMLTFALQPEMRNSDDNPLTALPFLISRDDMRAETARRKGNSSTIGLGKGYPGLAKWSEVWSRLWMKVWPAR
jgi:hypothetical protein